MGLGPRGICAWRHCFIFYFVPDREVIFCVHTENLMIYSGKMQPLGLLKYDYCEKSHALSLELGCRGNCCYSITNNYQRRIILSLLYISYIYTRRLWKNPRRAPHQPKTHLVGNYSRKLSRKMHTHLGFWVRAMSTETADAAAASKKSRFFRRLSGREDHEDPESPWCDFRKGKKREKIRTLSSWHGGGGAAAFCSNTATAR